MLNRIFAARRRHHFTLRGAKRPSRTAKSADPSRALFLGALFAAAIVVISARLIQLGVVEPDTESSVSPDIPRSLVRPDFVDRNGQLLATDMKVVSLFAEPNKIVDLNDAVEKLSAVLTDIDPKATYRKLSNRRSHFVWLRRHITPRQQSDILKLGIPGVGFRPERKRFYPAGPDAAHLIGFVDVDNRGMAGMEKYLDNQSRSQPADQNSVSLPSPFKLSIDIRVQSILRGVLAEGLTKYKAMAAGGVVLDVNTGEVIAMASVPDFDPNSPSEGSKDGWLNRMSNGTFEMGSTFKTFSTAMALDSGKVTMGDAFDASRPIVIGGFTIRDFHGKYRVLTVPEIFRYSSNIGTAKMVDLVGTEAHQAFLTRLGLLTRMETELPEVKAPSQPKSWKKINSITISFGHGVSTTPLQTAVAAAALMNGGRLLNPTFLPRLKSEADATGTVVVKKSTGDDIRSLFRMNANIGSGRSAQVPGYDVGGKTGTANKVVNGRYSQTLNFNAFLAAFPISDPKYVVLTFVDAPTTGEDGGRTAASTAAPMVEKIISRTARILGVEPSFGNVPVESF